MIALYARVSTQEQAREGYSIEEQVERLKKYSEAHGRYDYKVFVDAGYSGATKNRPDLQKIVKGASEGKIEKVIVYKLDRLSRSQKDTLELIEDVFLKNGVDFESMSERFDTSTSFGRAMVGILAVFAQLEREQIKERMSMGREGRAKLGKWHGGGNIPIGYEYINGELIPNEYEAMQIREAYELLLGGYTYKGIEGIFEEKGYKHKHGGWNDRAIHNVLTNDLYIGVVKFDGVKYKGTHKPLIDKGTFEKAQEICKQKYEAFKNNAVPRSSSYLGGLIYCAQCGAKYGISVTRWGKYRYNYYACYSRRKSNKKMVKDPNCKNKYWRMEELEQLVFSEIRKLQLDPNYIYDLRGGKSEQTENERKLDILQNEVKKLEEQRSRLIDLYGLGSFTPEELQEKVLEVEGQKEKLCKEIESIKNKEGLSTGKVLDVVKNFSDILDRGKFEEIRLIIETLIRKIEIDEDNVTIYWTFS